MKRIYLAFLFSLGISFIGYSQQAQKQFELQSQYETAIKNAIITVVGSGEQATSDAKGKVMLSVSPTDSVVLSKDGFSSAPVAIGNVGSDNVIKIDKSFSWKDLLTPMFYIINGGLWLILFIVFAETGLFAGFFLPGDSLLFVSGIYSTELATKGLGVNLNSDFLHLLIITLMVIAAAILGNEVGYWFGKKSGPALYHKKDSFFFKKKYLLQAHDFFEQRGASTIVIARFLPIIRTFAPIVAGIVKMDKKTFTYYNIVGSVAWSVSMMFGGHYLYKFILQTFGFDLKAHLEFIVLGIVLVTTLPVLYKLFFGKEPQRKEQMDDSWMEENNN